MPAKLIRSWSLDSSEPRIAGVVAILPNTVKVCVAFMLGEPSSVTTTVKTLVELFGAGTVQLKRPVFGLIVAPAGAPGPRLKVRVLAGISGSVAGTMKATVVAI